MNWLVISAALVMGVIAYREHQRMGTPDSKKKMFAWAGALWGSFLGSFFGIAGFGDAISGTIPGAVLGFFLVPIVALKAREEVPSRHNESSIAPDPNPEELSQDYRELVAFLAHGIKMGYIYSVSGHQIECPDASMRRAGEDAERKMDADLTWWISGEPRKWYAFLKNHSTASLRALCFAIAPGPTVRPTGPANLVYIKLHESIPPGFPFVVVFQTPKGSRDDVGIQNTVVISAHVV